MKWEKLLSSKRVSTSQVCSADSGYTRDLRSEFEKDYHRIIGSSSFRRLQDKTQVFALDKSDFIRTRLTHSLEVSSFARSLGQNIGECILSRGLDQDFTSKMHRDICDILQCAGLIHDIGNPPFGHFGEEAIRDWFARKLNTLSYKGKPVTEVLTHQMTQDFLHFEGNAQALRQVTKLHFLSDQNGMDLTYALLNSIIKYPVSSCEMDPTGGRISRKKMGYFYEEQPLYQQIAGDMGTLGVRHPLAFILEAADDIAYRTADIEDAFKKGFITYPMLIEELKKGQEKAVQEGYLVDKKLMDPVKMLSGQYQEGQRKNVSNPEFYAIQNFLSQLQSELLYCATTGFISNYGQIMDGTYEQDLFYGTCGDWVIRILGDIAYHRAFLSKQILSMEVSAWSILNFLMDLFVPAVIHYDTDLPQSMMDQKMVALISENYRQIYRMHCCHATCEEERLYQRLLLVTDFISGMTDTYAKDLYQKLNGIS